MKGGGRVIDQSRQLQEIRGEGRGRVKVRDCGKGRRVEGGVRVGGGGGG